MDTFELLVNLFVLQYSILTVLYQVDDLQDKYHECLEMLMENQVLVNRVQSLLIENSSKLVNQAILFWWNKTESLNPCGSCKFSLGIRPL